MQDLSKALHSNFQSNELASSLNNIRQQLIDSLEPIVQSSIQTSEMMSNISLSLENIAQPLFSVFQNQIDNLVSPALENILDNVRSLPEHLESALITLGNHGWFFDLDMPLPFLWELESTMNEGDLKAAEVALVEYFRKHLNSIQESIVAKYPHRLRILSPAFNAHNRGEYELSIPVFLAQTDGICFDVINYYLFIRSRKENKPMTSLYVDSLASNFFRRALLSPLSQPLPISLNKKERSEHFSELNRHQVMHGESLDYGTEINSLKSISLLNYITQVLQLDEENET